MKKACSSSSLLLLASIACGSGAALAQEADPNFAVDQLGGELLLPQEPAAGDPATVPAEGESVGAAMPEEEQPLLDDQMITEAPSMDAQALPTDQAPMEAPLDQALPLETPPMDVLMDQAQAPSDEAVFDAPVLDQATIPMDEIPADQAFDEGIGLPEDEALPDPASSEQALDEPMLAAPLVEDATPEDLLLLESPPPDQADDQPTLEISPTDQAAPEDMLLPEPLPVEQATDQPLFDAPLTDQAAPEDILLPEPLPVEQATDQPLFDAPLADQALPPDQLLPEAAPVDQATGQPLFDAPLGDQALPQDVLLPAPPTDQALAPEDQLLPEPPAEGIAAVPEDQLLPEPDVDQVAAPELQLDPAGDLALLPPAETGAQPAAVDVLGNPVDLTGQVLVTIQNASAAELMILVEPEGGGEPVPVMILEPGYQAVQPTPVGLKWRLAQDDSWVGGFVPTAEPQQLLRFDGAP